MLCRFVILGLRRVKVRGLENIPSQGAFIVAPNHSSYLDPVLVGSSCPFAISTMAKKELFSVPIFGRILPKINVFPVEREASDVGAVRTALKILKKGGPLLLFPEGSRGKKGRKSPKLGVGYFAAKAGVSVVPVLVTGADSFFSFKSIEVIWGEPVIAHENPSKDDYAKFTEDIIKKIYALTAPQDKETSVGAAAVGGADNARGVIETRI
ncbi:MAG: lysophospholipid acyltransferase family protein [Endomicrobiia bacterium]|nr:lysophospholipid acyltransferase family protein [Endomicrobiia bacterium]